MNQTTPRPFGPDQHWTSTPFGHESIATCCIAPSGLTTGVVKESAQILRIRSKTCNSTAEIPREKHMNNTLYDLKSAYEVSAMEYAQEPNRENKTDMDEAWAALQSFRASNPVTILPNPLINNCERL